jgi:hypothetical protein
MVKGLGGCFGWHGIKAGGHNGEWVKKKTGEPLRKDKDAKDGATKQMKIQLAAARKEAKRLGITLAEYLSLPKDQRSN